jgi:rubrerythrin
MAYQDIPVPQVARPRTPIDPYRHRDAFIQMLSSLYHAEAAAMEGFLLLTNPLYVQANELFTKASQRLVADERKHLADIERMIRMLGGSGILPPSPAEARFWNAWRSGELFALPFRSSTAAAFCLFSEGLGYAFLYNLAQATADPEIREMLMENVVDEQVHLRLSLSVLRRTMAHERDILTDFLIHLYGYALIAREPMREQRALLESLGLDFDVLVGSSIRFLFDLLGIALSERGEVSPAWRQLRGLAQLLGERPEATRILHWLMFLPEVPLSRQAVFGWGRLNLRRRGLRPTTGQQLARAAQQVEVAA